jgi:glutaredoxin
MVVLKGANSGMFRRWLGRSTDPVSVRLYERPGCHLCEDAESLLHRLSRRYPMRLQKVDIRSDPELVRRYDIVIPVIVVDKRFELTAPIDEHALAEALKSAQRSVTHPPG